MEEKVFYFSLPDSDFMGKKLYWFSHVDSVLPTTVPGEWSLRVLILTHQPFIVFIFLAQLRRGVTAQLWSALGIQPWSTHHKYKTTLINEHVKNSSILRPLLVSKRLQNSPHTNKSLATTITLAHSVVACHTVSPALLLFQLVLQPSGEVRTESTRSEKAVGNHVLQNFTFYFCEGGPDGMNKAVSFHL